VPHRKLTRKIIISFCPIIVPNTIFGSTKHLFQGTFDEESIGATFKTVQLTVKELRVNFLWGTFRLNTLHICNVKSYFPSIVCTEQTNFCFLLVKSRFFRILVDCVQGFLFLIVLYELTVMYFPIYILQGEKKLLLFCFKYTRSRVRCPSGELCPTDNVRSRNAWLSPILSSFIVRFWDDKTSCSSVNLKKKKKT
jgi:hypothetical protein